MAAHSVNISAGSEVTLILDPEKSTFLGNAPLYQSADDPTSFYLDEAMTVRVNLYTAVTKQEEKVYVVDAAPLPQNESFSKEQTLFLIDLMRQQLEADGESLLRALKELNPRVKSGKSRKKHMWREMATRLSKHFRQVFHPDHVARQWYTLENEYKKAKDDNRTASQDTVTFQFFSEMEELLGGHHDVEFPVVGTVKGVEVRRPKALNVDSGRDSPATAHTGSATSAATPTASATPTRAPLLKRRRTDEHYLALLDFLKESTAARQRRHEETMAQMKSAQDGFEALMNRFLDKI
ncbi:hypothetical protein PHYPO_G00167150 [Pangasianodon hypophthalmus]|uniref:Myb/SANT-like DNA-binding domain-containing protein n=1 Tax=Pangasianodon hypophthalmus TaxID=310915 RepID=A0A5N5JI22_PANHP|nr:uncharacterized protein LOC113544392 [Pangasianodon hypophthalmus]KAB5518532.1 hypothetical protein PHYPO_G00167150 [Pangasianodon hypophthalmus]